MSLAEFGRGDMATESVTEWKAQKKNCYDEKEKEE